VLVDQVSEGNAGVYVENTVHWTDWLKTTAGWRGDYYAASVDSILQQANSGNDKVAIGSPKLRVVFGPVDKTEFFLGAGMGYHSNDAPRRDGDAGAERPDPAANCGAIIVRSRGAEVGVRTRAIAGLDSSVSLFVLDQASELFFDGDTGDTTPGRPSQRTGIEFTNDYRPVVVGASPTPISRSPAHVFSARFGAGANLSIARRFPAGSDRQRAG